MATDPIISRRAYCTSTTSFFSLQCKVRGLVQSAEKDILNAHVFDCPVGSATKPDRHCPHCMDSLPTTQFFRCAAVQSAFAVASHSPPRLYSMTNGWVSVGIILFITSVHCVRRTSTMSTVETVSSLDGNTRHSFFVFSPMRVRTAKYRAAFAFATALH